MSSSVPSPDRSTARPRRGRPPRLSRQQIVAAAADMLVADPDAQLTIGSVAEAVGAAPMSLYRHFDDRDDLVAAVAGHVFSDARIPLAAGTPWQDEVHAWMTAVYRQARAVPQLMRLMAVGESREWMAHSAYLAGVLERAGVADDRVLAEAVFWVATTTMGHALIGAGRWDPKADLQQFGSEGLDPGDRARLARLVPYLEPMRDEGFERVTAWTIAGLESMLA